MSLFSLQASWKSCTGARTARARSWLAGSSLTTRGKSMGPKMSYAHTARNIQNSRLPPPSICIWSWCIPYTMRSCQERHQCSTLQWEAVHTEVFPRTFQAPDQPLRAGLAPCYASGLWHAAVRAAPTSSDRQRKTGLACRTTGSHCSLVMTTYQMILMRWSP